MLSIDINCDMGESSDLWEYNIHKDFELIRYVSSINVACGYHAGDKETMKLLVEEAIKNNVAIGAHPSFQDRKNFGRTNMLISRQRIYEIVLEQISVLNDVVIQFKNKLKHVKPHGALYNMAAKDKKIAEPICEAIKDFDNDLILFGLSGSELIAAGKEAGLKTCSEVFADRTYQDDKSLTPRSEQNAVINNPNDGARQILQMVLNEIVISTSGKHLPIKAETICIHGDGGYAIEFARIIHDVVLQNNILIGPLC